MVMHSFWLGELGVQLVITSHMHVLYLLARQQHIEIKFALAMNEDHWIVMFGGKNQQTNKQ